MARLTAEERRVLPNSAFAGPNRSYPVEDKAHARNAKARASEMANKGKLSTSTEKRIDRMADRKLEARPEPTARGAKGKGHEMPGMGSHAGSKVHGPHMNVVNAASHGMKLKHC
jgi:hypothetical protein